MSLFSVLHHSSRALQSASAGVQTTSNNVANINTPGYARESLGLSTKGTLNMRGLLLGQGVQSGEVHAAYDQFSQGTVYQRLGESGYHRSRSSGLRRLEALYVQDATEGLGASIANFFDGFSSLESQADDSSLRLGILADAHLLVTGFQQAAAELTGRRLDLDQQLGQMATAVNGLTAQIGAVNEQIVVLEAGGARAHDLRAQRTALTEDLAQLVPVRLDEDAGGSVTVIVAGHALVEGGASRPLSIVTGATTGLPEVHVRAGGASFDISENLSGGGLSALLDERTGTVPDLLDGLDNLAFDLATAVNTQHAAGVGLDGVTGRTFFEALSGPSGAASALALNAAVAGTPDAIAAASTAAGLPGDNANATALAALADQALANSSTRTFTAQWSELLSGLGHAASQSYTSELRSDLQLSTAQNLRDAVSGVSLEEEAVDLLRFQEAYQASARVLRTANEMLDELMQLV